MKTMFLLLAAIATPAIAQADLDTRGAPAPDAAAAGADGDIVVTALRVPLSPDRIASSVTVLDKAAIDRIQDPVVSDLLIRTPGVSFTRNGGYGTATSIRIRGAETDQTVLVIDGVRLADPSSTGGGYNFANLLTGDSSRIEVLRGPQSILWGSQAIGGVVNIVTATPTRSLEGSMDVEAGSRETGDGRMAVGGLSGPISWRIGANAITTQGISAISPRYGGQEKDGYDNVGATGRLGIALTQDVSLDLRGYYSNGQVDFDSSFGAPDTAEYSKNEEYIGYAGLNVALFDGVLRNRLSFSQAETNRLNIDPDRTVNDTTFDAKGRVRRFEYQGSVAIATGWSAVFGAEREEQRMRSASPPDSRAAFPITRGSASINSLYAQVNGEIVPGLTLTGGLRRDHHSSFGNSTVFGGGAAWSLFGGNTILRASYGEGFKAPTLYQLFSEYGNQALDPEKAHGWDAGIEQRLFDRHVTLSATWFDRRTRNLITFNSCPFAGTLPAICFNPATGLARFGYYANVQRSNAHGLELAGAATYGRFTLDGNYTYTVAEDRSPGVNFGNQLPRRPRDAANGSVSYAWPFGLTTGAAVRWSGRTFDTVRSSATVAPFRNAAYTVVDLRAEVPLGGGVQLFGRVENLFDEYYETARRYGQLGRSFYAGVRARF